jgi:CDP-diacylglycerol---serine O-phosphatidyltransferase
VITAFGLTCGLFVIFKTSIADPSRDLFSLLQASAILLLIAAAADVADGAVARLIKAESEFGIYFDSLADAVNFGVAPPLLLLKSLSAPPGTLSPFLVFFVIIASMIYALCGVLRLVRFNVQTKEAKPKEAKPKEFRSKEFRSNKKEFKKEAGHFKGFPIPAAGSCALSFGLILISPLTQEYLPLTLGARAIILSVVMIFLGYFMVSRWKFPSIKALHFRVPPIYLIFVTGILAVAILYGIVDYFPEAYFFISWLYFLISFSLSLIRLALGKKSKKLHQFEPDDK